MGVRRGRGTPDVRLASRLPYSTWFNTDDAGSSWRQRRFPVFCLIINVKEKTAAGSSSPTDDAGCAWHQKLGHTRLSLRVTGAVPFVRFWHGQLGLTRPPNQHAVIRDRPGLEPPPARQFMSGMPTRLFPLRGLAVLTALPLIVPGCCRLFFQTSATSSMSATSRARRVSQVPPAGPGPKPVGAASRVAGDGAALLAPDVHPRQAGAITHGRRPETVPTPATSSTTTTSVGSSSAAGPTRRC